MTRRATQAEISDHARDERKHDRLPNLYDRIPRNLSPTQREQTERELSLMACMMVHWFADRAFTCPDSLQGTIETYKGIIVAGAHNAVGGEITS